MKLDELLFVIPTPGAAARTTGKRQRQALEPDRALLVTSGPGSPATRQGLGLPVDLTPAKTSMERPLELGSLHRSVDAYHDLTPIGVSQEIVVEILPAVRGDEPVIRIPLAAR